MGFRAHSICRRVAAHVIAPGATSDGYPDRNPADRPSRKYLSKHGGSHRVSADQLNKASVLSLKLLPVNIIDRDESQTSRHVALLRAPQVLITPRSWTDSWQMTWSGQQTMDGLKPILSDRCPL